MHLSSSLSWLMLLFLQEEKPSVPDLKKLVDGIIEVLKLVFPTGVPRMILAILGWVLLLIILLGIIWTALWLISKIKRLCVDEIAPLFDKPDQARRIRRRALFAQYLKDELFRLNSQEEWGDHRFAELEATVEAEGLRSGGSLFSSAFLPWLRPTGVRREKSLSRAIASSAERLILLEGDPGAGKSVALRHVALKMALDAGKSKRRHQVLPVYINLKELKASPEHVDRAAIERFVLDSLNRINDRDVVEFLDHEFSVGIEAGTWFFLFDSFDEIPQILSSVEPDATIQLYSTAVADFLSGLNRCRGVIASRHFRGPKQFGWPKFTVLSLSEQRRNRLIRAADLTSAAEATLLTGLSVSTAEMTEMSRNPMFLGLLCDYVRTNGSFPRSVHIAFSTYTEHRLTRDAYRLYQRFGLTPDNVRNCAQEVAFCMSSEPGLGLSPDRPAIRAALGNQGFTMPEAFESALDALEFIKLARGGTLLPGEPQRFTFAHRRFQEYFSTSVVLREPNRVSAESLLSDGRWRETAVVLFQLQPSAALVSLLVEAAGQLKRMVTAAAAIAPRETTESDTGPGRFYSWPPRCLHLLGVLQEGFSRRPEDLPGDLRELVSKLLTAPARSGDLGSRKYAVEVAASASSGAFVEILRSAFQSNSEWLRNAGYRQLSHLKEVPDDIATAIRLSIVRRAFFPRPRSEGPSISTYLSRLNDSARFVVVSNVMRWVFMVDCLAHVTVFVILLQYSNARWFPRASLLILILLSHVLFRYHFMGRSVSAVSRPLAAVFDWQWMVLLRLELAFVPLTVAVTGMHWTPDHGGSMVLEAIRHLRHLAGANWIGSFGVLYLLMWAPATIVTAINWGLSTPWVVLATPAKLVAKECGDMKRRLLFTRLALLPLVSAVMGGCVYVLVVAIAWIPDSAGRLIAIACIVFGATGVLYLLGEPVLRVSRDVHRWRRWQVQHRGRISPLTGAEFVDSWLSFETQLFRTRFVRRVRDLSLLTIGEETTLALQEAVGKLQVKREPAAESNVAIRLRAALISDPLAVSRRRSEEAETELLDELFIMLERMRQSGPDTGPKAEKAARY